MPFAAGPMTPWIVIGSVFVGIIFLILFFLFISFFGLWIQCKTTGTKIGFFDLIFMKFRKVHVGTIVRAAILSKQAGLPVTRKDLENHFLSAQTFLS